MSQTLGRVTLRTYGIKKSVTKRNASFRRAMEVRSFQKFEWTGQNPTMEDGRLSMASGLGQFFKSWLGSNDDQQAPTLSCAGAHAL